VKLQPFYGQKRWLQGIAGGVIAALLSLILWDMALLEVWESKTWDWRESRLARPSLASDQICLILVDQGSLDWMSQSNGLSWPWPREIYSVIVDFCKRNQAKSLSFDVLFTEPSTYGVEDDRAFGRAVADYGKVASAAFLKKLSGSHTKWPEDTKFKPIIFSGVESWLKSPGGQASLFPRAVMPIPELTATSAMLCNVQQEPDSDGIYRRARMVSIFDNHLVPSLALGSYFAGENWVLSRSEVDLKQHYTVAPGLLKIGNRTIPLDEEGEAILRYRGPSGTHKTYSAASIIKSEIEFRKNGPQPVNKGDGSIDRGVFKRETQSLESGEFKDKYVFFSFSAPGLFDLRSSPVDSVYPGVEIQATMLDNFLAGDFIRKAQRYSVILYVIFLTLICSVCITFFKGALLLFLAGSFCLALPVGISLVAYEAGIWMPLVVQEIATLLAILFSMGLNYASEGRQRRFIKSAFSQYLSPIFIEQLIQHPEKLKLGGERKELSIFFSDLQGFTSISEKLSPEELTSLLNNYLSAMTKIIHEEGGTVDKYEGDAIIAFWNAPLDVPNHESCAVRAALRCQKRLAQMRPEMRKVVGTDMLMRIGLNTGVVVVGNMGSHSRFDYTMLGDAVNLAARLEGANKEFGTYTMISAFTCKAIRGEICTNPTLVNRGALSDFDLPAKDCSKESTPEGKFAFRELARLAVVGKKEAVTVFEPMFQEEFENNKDLYIAYDQGLQHFYNGQLSDALEIFSAIAHKDSAASAYVKKCSELLSEFAKNRPAELWNGVWTMTRK